MLRMLQAPRSEAMSLLGSLLCFPHHFEDIPVLQPNERDLVVAKCSDVKVTRLYDSPSTLWTYLSYTFLSDVIV